MDLIRRPVVAAAFLLMAAVGAQAQIKIASAPKAA
jgi:hypothetical protein